MMMKGSSSGVGPVPEPVPSPAAFLTTSSGALRFAQDQVAQCPLLDQLLLCASRGHAVKRGV